MYQQNATHRTPLHADSIELGDRVQDRLSGFSGIAAAKVEYLTGCTQIGVMPEGLTAEGKTKEWAYFDWQRLVVTDVADATGFKDMRTSQATVQRNGAGELPPAPADFLRRS